MFGKTKCGNCGEKIKSSYDFCPYCRASTSSYFEEDDWGLIGKNDSSISPYDEIRLPSGIGTLFNSLLRSLNNQMKDLEKSGPKKKNSEVKTGGIGISIHTSGNKPPEIRVTSFGNMPQIKEKSKKIKKEKRKIELPNSSFGKFSGLPKEEPVTNIRRFSDKVVYEISIPGVKSLKDISIVQLEDSIEIKALAKGKVFHKIIPINLPIKNYNFSRKKLVLELEAE